MERTDVHRPSVIVPADYDFVAFGYQKVNGIGDCEAVLAEWRVREEHMKRTGGTWSQHEHGGNCDVCGSVNLLYDLIYYHAKTNTYIRVGQDCASNLDMGCTRDFNAFQRRVKDALEHYAGKRKAQAVLVGAGLQSAWDYYVMKFEDIPSLIVRKDDEGNVLLTTLPYEEQTIRDIVGKLVKYGSISDKQKDYLRKLLDKITQRAQREAEREAEKATAKGVPEGRYSITGTILSIKDQESDYGIQTKMLVKHEDGWKVWSTLPYALSYSKVGDVVTFTATVTRSRDDRTFGFAKRPTAQHKPNFPEEETSNA